MDMRNVSEIKNILKMNDSDFREEFESGMRTARPICLTAAAMTFAALWYALGWLVGTILFFGIVGFVTGVEIIIYLNTISVIRCALSRRDGLP